MSLRSAVAKNLALRVIVMVTLATALITTSVTNVLRAQARQIATPPKVRIPDESAGIDGIARTLVSAFDQADIVALGEVHQRRLDSDLRIAVVRNPDFAKKVRSIVVEFANTTEQSTLDRYIRGENVSRAQLEQVWKTTTQAANGTWDDPIYADFFAAVREVNSKLPADARVRVFGGDPGPGDNRSRETAAFSVLKEQVLQKHGKALVIYGAGHFWRTLPKEFPSSMGEDIGLARMLEGEYPGRTFVVIPVGGPVDLPPGVTLNVHPDYQKFDQALRRGCDQYWCLSSDRPSGISQRRSSLATRCWTAAAVFPGAA